MAARPASALPPEERAELYSFEPKWDGFRCLAFRTPERALLQSRQLRPLTRYFPEVAAGLVEQLPPGTVVDGELCIYRGGRLDFTALQRRIHPSAAHAARRGELTPATLVAFDVLVSGGVDLRGRPYWARREHLELLLRDARPPLALTPATRDLAAAQAWLAEHAAAGIEGVVVKDVRRGYRPSRTSWEKVRTRATVDAVVGGVLGPLDEPHALVLGRPDGGGRLRVAGRTRPLPQAARVELGALLAPPRGGHPWPARISSSRFGQLPPEPVAYTQVEPLLVVEVDADVCWEQGRWRHPTVYRRLRVDLVAGDLDTSGGM
ncbi:ATP-dependent DNA ligase [Pseudonocardia zijingensis]|uniref:ATP-dependent DNA ligase n=1 Tax=Pseudonocardia zijingensis TaxID=153376 RepID=A0ABP4AB42_9PSEU